MSRPPAMDHRDNDSHNLGRQHMVRDWLHIRDDRAPRRRRTPDANRRRAAMAPALLGRRRALLRGSAPCR